MSGLDAVVVGTGPNGLTAAAVLARAGWSVRLFEANASIGGGVRSWEWEPGLVVDHCAAVHPLGVASPAFAELGLERHGLEWVHPELPYAHPLDDMPAAVAHRSLSDTLADLGPDADGWRRLVGATVQNWDRLLPSITGPLARRPRHPLALAGFGARAVWPASWSGRLLGPRAAALLAGNAAHSMLALSAPFTSSFALVLGGAAHVGGWPVARGGSQAIAAALAAVITEAGGEIVTGQRVSSLDQLPASRVVLFDLTPPQVAAIVGSRLPGRVRARMERFRFGPGSFKVDHLLDGPVPWADGACARAGTVHVGGTLAEIAAAEAEVAAGRLPERPFVLVAQQGVADPDRSPDRRQVLWSYCHVPSGFSGDATARIEAQIERFAPGFRDRIVDRRVTGPAAFEADNANLVGGDIGAGALSGRQLLWRPGLGWHPYRLAGGPWYLCGASTPPGAGVHGMCGYHAARSVLGDLAGADSRG